MARISRIFRLGKSQYELDFVDVDIDKDKPLFLNPFTFSVRSDTFSINANRSIRSFFQHNLELIRAGKSETARKNFIHLNEPNETCLGLSSAKPRGRGMGGDNTADLFRSIKDSEAVKTGMLDDLEDTSVFIEGIGRDKVSDMTTNIVRAHLIKYTQQQCDIHGISLTPDVPSGFFWDTVNLRWDNILTDMLIVKGKKILLVPKGIVSFSREYSPDKYHRHFALTYLQEDHIRRGTPLVRKTYNKKGEVINQRVFKKDLIEEELPPTKDDLLEFTRKHPEVFRNFKARTATKEKSLKNSDIGTSISLQDVVDHLISELQEIQPGNRDAQRYHRLMFGVLELIFYPILINPYKEREINEGRKRVDIMFDNGGPSEGFLYRLQHTHEIPCQYIFIECKNYSDDIENPEVDQMIGRFSVNKGKFGIIVCRKVQDMGLLISRCRDAYLAGQGLIIPLTDEDITSLLKNKAEGGENSHPEELVLSNRAREIML